MERRYFMFFKRKMWFFMELAYKGDTIYWKVYNYQYNLVNKNFCFGNILKLNPDLIELIEKTIFEDSDDPENKIETIMEFSKEEFDFLISK